VALKAFVLVGVTGNRTAAALRSWVDEAVTFAVLLAAEKKPRARPKPRKAREASKKART
jgi:hypothetical protein